VINLKEIRIKQNLTQAQLADKMGVSRVIVGKWENNGNPTYKALRNLATALNCTITDLLKE
jgi:transcriptional regulator with XRE-family HTH domain